MQNMNNRDPRKVRDTPRALSDTCERIRNLSPGGGARFFSWVITPEFQYDSLKKLSPTATTAITVLVCPVLLAVTLVCPG